MKKLMIALAAVAVAAVTQAASVDWSVGKNSWTLDSGSPAAAGYTVYLINGATSLETIAAAIDSTTGAFDADQSWVYGSSVTANAKGTVAELTTTTDKLTRGTSYDFSVLIVDAGATGGPKYMVSATSSAAAYSAAQSDEPVSIAFGSESLGANALTYTATSAANGWAAAAVPEPTSGLLLLLGVAGLALKRKRA